MYGVNLIARNNGTGAQYYLFNAHGDVVNLTDSTGTSTKAYDYDAFGVERNIDDTDANPFRYCGEYYDAETGTYYLRARYYDPAIGRFTQEDTHWNVANMIYGDNPQRINQREDALGLKYYSYLPQIGAAMQSGNLYVYCVNDSVTYADPSGNEIIAAAILIGMVVSAASYIFTTLSSGGNLNAWELAVALAVGGATFGLSAWGQVGATVLLISNTIISAVGIAITGGDGTETVISAEVGAVSTYVPGMLSSIVELDDVGKVIVSITGGVPFEIFGNAAKILNNDSTANGQTSINTITEVPATIEAETTVSNETTANASPSSETTMRNPISKDKRPVMFGG